MTSTPAALSLASKDALVTAPAPWLDRAEYPFGSRYQAVSGGRLHYLDEGTGETLLFAHGTPTWSFEWRHLVRGLSGRYRCVAPDHLGFGLSDRPRDADYSPEAHAARFRAFVEALDLRDITLVVHDFGGPIALPTALATPGRVRRLVVINSWMWPFDDDPRMLRIAKMAGSWWMRLLYRYANLSLRLVAPNAYGDRRKLTPAIQSQYLAPFREPWARDVVLFRLASALHGSRAHYRDLWERRGVLGDIPALIIWGTKDGAFPPAMLDRWSEALPQARTVRVEGAGHWPHEEAPEEVSGALEEFLAG